MSFTDDAVFLLVLIESFSKRSLFKSSSSTDANIVGHSKFFVVVTGDIEKWGEKCRRQLPNESSEPQFDWSTQLDILALVGRLASPNIPHARCTHPEVELRTCCLGQSEESEIPYYLIKGLMNPCNMGSSILVFTEIESH